jgi:hypothetical protein
VSPQRLSPDGARLSPGSPLKMLAGGPMVQSENHSAFVAHPLPPPTKKKGAAAKPATPLWMSEGGMTYATENREKFVAHPVPPPAAKAVVKYEASTLPFHDATIYRSSYTGTVVPRREIHKPQQQTTHA